MFGACLSTLQNDQNVLFMAENIHDLISYAQNNKKRNIQKAPAVETLEGLTYRFFLKIIL
jgi:hypothetical protein